MKSLLLLRFCHYSSRHGTAALLVGLAVIGSSAVFAQAAATSTDAPAVLPAYQVTSDRVAGLEARMTRAELRQPEPNLGRELMDIPGVYGHSRAADAMEPNIRGLGFDRVTTTLNGIPLFNGSPERTYSPVVVLGPVAVESVNVIKALPSVALGPITTGGHIELSTGAQSSKLDGSSGYLGTTYNGARSGFSSQGLFAANRGSIDARLTFFRNDLGDYTAPNRKVVAARLDDYGNSAALGWHNDQQQFHAEYLHRRLRLNETVSLPLDGRNSDADIVVAKHRWEPVTGPLQRVELRAGYGYTDPYITSEKRIVPAPIFAQATTRSAAAGVITRWRAGDYGTIATGVDWTREERRAVRTTAAGQDFIWPDAIYADAGAFAEWQRHLTPEWALRIGVRADQVKSDARDVDRLALGRPIRQQFINYNGPDAATIQHRDVVGAGNALLQWKGHAGLSAFVGAGLSEQPAPVTERYRAFLNALGGDGKGGNAVELGNPALRPEQKQETVAGATWTGPAYTLHANLYYYRIRDFINRLPIGTTLPPVAPMVVFGYRNVDADFRGGELGLTLRPAAGLTVPLSFARSDGRNAKTGVSLPEIPPWEGTAALRYDGSFRQTTWWAQAGARLVGAKTNPAPLDNPLYTSAGSFALAHVRAGVRLSSRVRIEVGLENLFNRQYTEYLTPPVAPFQPASGTLRPGDRVPGPARALWTSVAWEF
jgi:iron complex outermembrane recepter protein